MSGGKVKHYLETKETVLNEFGSSAHGLSDGEALKRLERDGRNKLKEAEKVPLLKRFLLQLADPMIIMLLVSAVISAVTAAYSGESFMDVFIILFVVVVNAVLGVIQESKAEQAIDALKQMSGETAKVYRNGDLKHVPAEEIVRGDIVLLEAGDAIPADGRLIETASLKVEESSLTGESVPSDKDTKELSSEDGKDIPLGDRANMVYMGSTVAYGRGVAVITDTGMSTEMGKIADALTQAENEETPLQKKLSELSRVLTYIVTGICLLIFVLGVIENGSFTIPVLIKSFMIAVSLAVAAIPEGLSAVITIVLSIGVTKMAKRRAIIRKLTAVETLGCTQIICSDKTGTLTQNKMTVVQSVTSDEDLLAKAMTLCCDSVFNSEGEVEGEPTENALVNYGLTKGINKNEYDISMPRIGEVPFDSDRKRMSTIHDDNGSIVQYTKGAPDEVLKVCSGYLTEEGIVPMTEERKEEILSSMTAMADKALRVLGAAYRVYDNGPSAYDVETCEKDMIFIGLVGMIDPIRPEVKDAVEQCRSAGIRVVMITGDHRNTAIAIAKDLGIIENEDQVLTGLELDEIPDEEFATKVEYFRVYARVQPEHKVRIVKAWKALNAITAMTGDGVNDAASIKAADIGVGMGITGTDVTKRVADMVLADDNFATIVSAVEEGRKIYDNIKKCIQFLLSSNLAEVLCIMFSTLLNFTIMQPVHLLWINLVTDCFPALALGMENAEDDVMKMKPRPSDESIFAGRTGIEIIYQGILVTILTFISFAVGYKMEFGTIGFGNSVIGTTMAFLTMSMAEIFHSLNMRSQRHSIFSLKTQNIYLFGSMILSFILTAAVIFVPFLRKAVGLYQLTIGEYAVAMFIALSIIPIVELVKLIERTVKKR